LLREVFVWAYERSCERYQAMQSSLPQPDPFRLKYRAQLSQAVSEVVRTQLNRPAAQLFTEKWVTSYIPDADQERVQKMILSELEGLHEGNFARHRILSYEYHAWKETWLL
jgi:hypothetical protein